jgi:hypothetical protein
MHGTAMEPSHEGSVDPGGQVPLDFKVRRDLAMLIIIQISRPK